MIPFYTKDGNLLNVSLVSYFYIEQDPLDAFYKVYACISKDFTILIQVHPTMAYAEETLKLISELIQAKALLI